MMKLATDLRLTFEEYLRYEENSDTRYELVKGELIPMSLGTGRHGKVIKFVDDQLNQSVDRNQTPWTSQRLTVGIQSPRGNRWDTCRIPDVTVLGLEQWNEMDDREAVTRAHEAAPLLVVEVVSPSTRSEDYSAKWSEYAVLDIGEYWIVDLGKNVVVICTLIDGRYQDVEYQELDIIRSKTFPDLNLTAAKILNSTAT
jgi:Uma2 family endonuclease